MRTSIKGQFILLFVLLGLTPIAVTFAIYSPGMLKDLTIQVTQGLCTRNKSQVRLVTLWLREKLNETELLATSPQLISCLKSTPIPPNFPLEKGGRGDFTAGQLQQFLEDKRLAGLYLFDKAGELRAFAGKDAEVVLPHLDKERLREALQGSPSLYCPPAMVTPQVPTVGNPQPAVGGLVAKTEGGGTTPDSPKPIEEAFNHSLFIFMPIYVPAFETKEIIGALVSGIDLHQSEGILEDIYLPSTHSFLVNSDGNVLACLTSGPDCRGKACRAPTSRTGSLTEGARACLESKKEGYSPYAYTSHLGQKVLGAWGWIPELGAGVIVEVDAREAFGPIFLMRGRLWWLLLIIGVGVTFVAIFTGRRLSEPFISLASTAQKIAQGHLEERANIQSPNEIGELGQCINLMAESLQEKNAQLAKLNEELRLLKRG